MYLYIFVWDQSLSLWGTCLETAVSIMLSFPSTFDTVSVDFTLPPSRSVGVWGVNGAVLP